MFGGEIKTKLPELSPDKSVINESTRDRDWSHELTHKVYADDKSGAAWNPIVPGHQVLLKNTKTTGKLAPNIEPEPYIVVAKEGHQVTMKSSEGAVYRRETVRLLSHIFHPMMQRWSQKTLRLETLTLRTQSQLN